MRGVAGARVVTPEGVLDGGWVLVEGDTVAAIGAGRAPDGCEQVSGWLLPGFVDLHMHGGGGHDVTESAQDMAGAVEFHRAHGTTATLISLVTAPVDALCEQLSSVADLAETAGSGVLGAHLEGPFLSPARCGAQNPAHLVVPDRGALRDLLGAARGHLRCMTVAPELPGALEVIDDLRSAGGVAAIGHTDATYEEATAACDRGARLATHLHNGMRPIHHRDPGPVLAALDAGVVCEVISDGVHVHPAILREVHSRGPGRLALVTDAIDATGMDDGHYRLGGQDVVVSAGQARLAATGALAGSTLTMDVAVRRAIDGGLPVTAAVEAASATPARLLGVDGAHGLLTVGGGADFVLLDEELRLRRVAFRGEWLCPSVAAADDVG